jgi:hypothetical protein
MNRFIYEIGGIEGAYRANFALQTLVLCEKELPFILHFVLTLMLESMVIKM